MTTQQLTVISFLLCGAALTVHGGTDLTRVPESSGEEVVVATLTQIHESCAFENDYLFLRRLAYVVSRNGLDQHTYRQGFGGGIWQISQTNFENTKNVQNVDYALIQKTLNVSWAQTQWRDLRKPLYSGIAAMLTLILQSPIPKDTNQQSQFFEKWLSGNKTEYKEEVARLNVDCKTDNLDMAFVLDASSSISGSDYKRSKEFTENVLGGFNIRPASVRVAAISFSSQVRPRFGFLDHNTTSAAQAAVSKIPKYGGGTNTAAALNFLRTSVFTESEGSRSEAAKIAIIQTDGQSNDYSSTITAAKKLKDEGIIVFAIGVGQGVNKQELADMASPPACTHVRLINDFTELSSIVTDLKSTACKTEVVQETNTTNTYKCSGEQSIKVEVDADMSILTRPELGQVDIYGSFQNSQPNSAFADFASAAAGGKPTVIYIANTDKPLYLNIKASMTETENCSSTYLVKIVSTNSLKKTGASNLCIKDAKLEECTDIDYVESGDFVKVNSTTGDNGTRVCEGGLGYRRHPDTKTKYVYCAPKGQAYVIDCPKGFAYLESHQDCIAPASLKNGAECDVCSKDNWEIGLRKFPVPVQTHKYINCTGVKDCDILQCSQQSHYVPGNQTCSESNNNNDATIVQGSILSVLVAMLQRYV